MWVQPVYAICCGLSITQTLNVVLVSVQNLKVCRLAQNSVLIFGCSRFVPCPVVQFGQLAKRFCVLPVLAGRLFAVGKGFQKFFGFRWKVHVFFSFSIAEAVCFCYNN
nr:MAG TPA: hypothetical protein [Bacteriophage sp.]